MTSLSIYDVPSDNILDIMSFLHESTMYRTCKTFRNDGKSRGKFILNEHSSKLYIQQKLNAMSMVTNQSQIYLTLSDSRFNYDHTDTIIEHDFSVHMLDISVPYIRGSMCLFGCDDDKTKCSNCRCNYKLRQFIRTKNVYKIIMCAHSSRNVDISMFEGIPKVTIQRCRGFSDATPLANAKELDLSGCYDVIDVSMLGNVEKLSLSFMSIRSGIDMLGNVKELSLHDYKFNDDYYDVDDEQA
jgi:hypothetical protein